MDKKLLILAKSIESLVTRELSNTNQLNKKPSVSYVSDIALNFPAIRDILSSFDGSDMVRVIFVAFNLLNGDSDEVAMNRAKDIFMFDIETKQGEEYNKMVTCDVCNGDGKVKCQECDGDGEVECDSCNTLGKIRCDECLGNGEVDDEECHYCGGDGDVTCRDCGGNGNVHCDECYGDGNVKCVECGGGGEVKGYDTVIDIQMSSIITQNPKLMEELDTIHDHNNDMIKEFNNFIKKYIEEILVIDVINDTIDFSDVWSNDSSVNDKLENIFINFNDFKISKNNKKGKYNFTALT